MRYAESLIFASMVILGYPRRLSAVHNLAISDASSRIARIDHELRFVHDALVIVVRVIGDDDDAIVLAEILEVGAHRHIERDSLRNAALETFGSVN